MSHTVLIAASAHIAALQQQGELTGAEAYSDADALKALEAITRQRPAIVAIGKPFATSVRGSALISRIKADPALAACEIRIIEPDGGLARAPARQSDGPAAAGSAPGAAAETDYTGLRRAPRVVVSGSVEILIDGSAAALIDISLVGAQVSSPLALRPNQRVRVQIADDERPVRLNGIVAWAIFEMSQGGPRYRAGVNFYDAAPEMVARFIDSIT